MDLRKYSEQVAAEMADKQQSIVQGYLGQQREVALLYTEVSQAVTTLEKWLK